MLGATLTIMRLGFGQQQEEEKRNQLDITVIAHLRDELQAYGIESEIAGLGD